MYYWTFHKAVGTCMSQWGLRLYSAEMYQEAEAFTGVMATGDPLSTGVDLHSAGISTVSVKSKELSSVSPVSDLSVSDPNENVVHPSSEYNKTSSKEKMFDFLVWYHSTNKEVAKDIYSTLEGDNLHGYVEERDRVAGKYKVSAMEEVIKGTDKILLLLSKEALDCGEFRRKMQTTLCMATPDSVIPIYLGLDKKERPRMLQHYVDITYEDDRFLNRLLASVSTLKKASKSDRLSGHNSMLSKPQTKHRDSSARSSAKRTIRVVPGRRSSTPSSSPRLPTKSGEGWWSKLWTKKQSASEEQSYQLKTIRPKSNRQTPKNPVVP